MAADVSGVQPLGPSSVRGGSSDGIDAGANPKSVSFASTVASLPLRPRFPVIDLPARQYGQQDGKPVIHFTNQEFSAGAKLFQHSLVAKFTVGRPSISEIRTVFKANWHIQGRATISDIWDSRHIMIILDSEDDVRVALTSPIRKVGHALFRLFRFSVDYNPKRELTTTTKWLRLPGLPPPLFNKSFIGAIVNSFSSFLDVDERTKACSTMRYARCCVELDVTKDIPKEVKITLPNGMDIWQDIVVEGKMSYCFYCKIHGHELADCKKKKTPKVVDGAPAYANKSGAHQGSNLGVNPPQLNNSSDVIIIDKSVPDSTKQDWQPALSKNQKRKLRKQKKVGGNTVDKINDGSNGHIANNSPSTKEIKEGEIVVIKNTSTPAEKNTHINAPSHSDIGIAVRSSSAPPKEAPINVVSSSNEDIHIRSEVPAVGSPSVTPSINRSAAEELANIPPKDMDMSSSGEQVALQISEVPMTLPEDKIASYGSNIVCYDEDFAPLDARGLYLHLKTKYNDDADIFNIMDHLYKVDTQAQNDSPSEASDGSIDLSRILKQPRQKMRGSRHSGRSCPKKKDPNFVY